LEGKKKLEEAWVKKPARRSDQITPHESAHKNITNNGEQQLANFSRDAEETIVDPQEYPVSEPERNVHTKFDETVPGQENFNRGRDLGQEKKFGEGLQWPGNKNIPKMPDRQEKRLKRYMMGGGAAGDPAVQKYAESETFLKSVRLIFKKLLDERETLKSRNPMSDDEMYVRAIDGAMNAYPEGYEERMKKFPKR